MRFKRINNKIKDWNRDGAWSDDVYKSSLWYYDLLLFTVDEDTDSDSSSSNNSSEIEAYDDTIDDTDEEEDYEGTPNGATGGQVQKNQVRILVMLLIILQQFIYLCYVLSLNQNNYCTYHFP